MPALDPTTNPDVQEALSRRYSDTIVILLPLKCAPHKFAVFNSARDLCGFVNIEDNCLIRMEDLAFVWEPPKPAPTLTKPPVDLEELDLI